jgi:hypothetical protein
MLDWVKKKGDPNLTEFAQKKFNDEKKVVCPTCPSRPGHAYDKCSAQPGRSQTGH